METQRETGLPVTEFHMAVAVGLTLLVAGFGHLYRRRFRRGLAWVVLFVCTLVLSTYTVSASEPFVTSVLNGELSAMNVAFPGSIMLLSLLDLYLLDRVESENGE
ncbi:hypothetical protein GRX03_01760 [Halovenus sp. WSH3]|uniref:Uncharacterized protein n=1 Tax=Halovenus carboxidivorans TaxID=2692199 RepID=A0A6B0T275_9EURY|nr:hypothetical protein [Halovenus carboxidivorans]MXR50336.1 hypothetical protein [Halovenus carboxidivorans]